MNKQELRKELIALLTSLSYKQLERCEYHPNIPIVVDEYLSIEKEIPTIQVDPIEYERLKELDKKQLIKEFEKQYSNNPYGIVYSTLEETKEDKDHSTFILLVSIIILLGYIIYKIETYFNS